MKISENEIENKLDRIENMVVDIKQGDPTDETDHPTQPND